MGRVLIERIRGVDCAARIGGDEFIMLLDATLDQAHSVLNRVHEKLVNYPLSIGNYDITVSIGIAWCTDSTSFESALHIADQKIYENKNRR